MAPQVSVVIPVMNGMPYIKNCVDSILESSRTDLELLISDNASDDGTAEYLKTITDNRVKVNHLPKRVSAAENWTLATRDSTGRYVKLVCADDLISPEGLDRQINCALNNPSAKLIASKRSIVDYEGKIILRSHGLKLLTGAHAGISAITRSLITGTNQFGEPTAVLFERSALVSALPWSSEFPYVIDLDMYVKVLKSGSFVGLDSVDATFRLTPGSWSSEIGNQQAKQFYAWINKVESLHGIKLNFLVKFSSKVTSKLNMYARRLITSRNSGT